MIKTFKQMAPEHIRPMARPSRARHALYWRRPAAIALLGTSLLLAWMALRLLLAALFSIQAHEFIADWGLHHAPPSPQAYEVARQAATKAIDLFPVPNGAYLDNLAQIHLSGQQGHPFGDPAAAPGRQQALAAYRESVTARPLWPWAWTEIAYTKLSLGERDAEFRTALQQAHTLGPWRPSINRRIAEIGLIAWRSLDNDTRTLTLEAGRRVIAQGGSADAKWLQDLAKRNGREEVVCNALSEQIKQEHQICSP
jgi:hypothetical protein